MEAQVASLLLIVASVAFSSAIIGIATVTMQQTIANANNDNSTLVTQVNGIMNDANDFISNWSGTPTNQTATEP
jgi:lipopolysaccharide export LptBFGC system permease protein LptF